MMLLKHAWIVPLALIATKPAWASETSPSMGLRALYQKFGDSIHDYMAASRLGMLSTETKEKIADIINQVSLALEVDKDEDGALSEDAATTVKLALTQATEGDAKGATKTLLEFVSKNETVAGDLTPLIITLIVDSGLTPSEISESTTSNESIQTMMRQAEEKQGLQRHFEELHKRALEADDLKSLEEELCQGTSSYVENFGENILTKLNSALCSLAHGDKESLAEFVSQALKLCRQTGSSSQSCGDVRRAAERLFSKFYPNGASGSQLEEDMTKLRGTGESLLTTPLEPVSDNEVRGIVTYIKNLLGDSQDRLLTASQYEELLEILQQSSSLGEIAEGDGELSPEKAENLSPTILLLLAIKDLAEGRDTSAKYICAINSSEPTITESCAEAVSHNIYMKDPDEVKRLQDFLQKLKTAAAQSAADMLNSLLVSTQSKGSGDQDLEDNLSDVDTTLNSFPSSSETVGGSTVTSTTGPSSVGMSPAKASARATALVEATQKLADAIKAGTPIALDAFTSDELIVLSHDKAQCLLLVQSVQPETVHAKKDFLRNSVCKGLHITEAVASLSDGPLKKAWSEVCGVGGSNYVLWVISAVLALVLVGAAIGGIIFMRG